MPRRRKLTVAQWIVCGEQVKRVNAELSKLIQLTDGVCSAKDYDTLFKLRSRLFAWSMVMENLAAEVVPSAIVIGLFTGRPWTEESLKRLGIDLTDDQPS
jgi:hypothetical protein